MTELQAHWDALHHGERADHRKCGRALYSHLVIPEIWHITSHLDDPKGARVEWGEPSIEQDVTMGGPL